MRGNKSASRIDVKVPAMAKRKKEKVEETSMKIRNDGVGSKTETRTDSKTNTTGIRGIAKESNVTTNITTTKTTKSARGGENSSETKTETEGSSVRQKYSKKRRF